MIDKTSLWIVIILLGLGSFGLRFVFTGLIGDRPLPVWMLRHLRYTAVAVLPGLVAPLVVWPAATGGTLDAPRMVAALITLAVGYFTRNVILAITLGALALYGGLALFG
ncbi:AzlD domain-containing protein [uncultured Roseovarius sp.]|uniref:AzlD domain-containing protein n=1 Tax=uncultured Roseovarius sp. TaxID=293344 RepID=UPI0025DFABF1|nr:AzlD domain-containing protein [uncultured Roseovarius sp.]